MGYPILCFVCVAAEAEAPKGGATVFKGTLLCKDHARKLATDEQGAIFECRRP